MAIGVILMSILIITSVLIFTLQTEQMSLDKIQHKSWYNNTHRTETDEERVIRLITNIGEMITK